MEKSIFSFVLRYSTRQQVVILRTYAKYLRQAGFPYSQAHIEGVLNGNPRTARSLVELFEAMFDPAAETAAVGTKSSQLLVYFTQPVATGPKFAFLISTWRRRSRSRVAID